MTQPFVLLDTNIVSFMFRRDTRAEPFLPRLAGKTACIAAQTVAEVHYGAQYGKWGKTRYGNLIRHIDGFTVLVADKETAELWAELALQAQACGRPMAASDVWVLATAERWEIPLLSHDKDFSWYDGPVEIFRG